jgi:uncharacterized OsmC-like protein
MTSADNRRSISITRTAPGRFRATNSRGGTLDFGGDDEFSPVELLMVAIGGCSGVDVDLITGRRAQPDSFQIDVAGAKVRGETGNHMEDLSVTFTLRFPEGDAGDAARAVLPEAMRQSHERLCTVSRTVEEATPVEFRLG